MNLDLRIKETTNTNGINALLTQGLENKATNLVCLRRDVHKQLRVVVVVFKQIEGRKQI